MDELVASMLLALDESINEIDWMSEATKTEARAKLASFDPKLGYRPNLETYAGLAITADDPIANRMVAARKARAYLATAQTAHPAIRAERLRQDLLDLTPPPASSKRCAHDRYPRRYPAGHP